MTTRTDELNEARALVRDLSRVTLKNDGDRRFIESWRLYLDRTGDLAELGRWRMASLRRVAASYGLYKENGAVDSAPGLD
jgi:Arc/MetJ family transcription regulator